MTDDIKSAVEAAKRIADRTGGYSSEEFGYHTPTSDAAVVARALLSLASRVEKIEAETVERCAKAADARAAYWEAERKRATGKLNKETRDCCAFKHDGARDAAFAIRALSQPKE
jgi:hypothetical protein